MNLLSELTESTQRQRKDDAEYNSWRDGRVTVTEWVPASRFFRMKPLQPWLDVAELIRQATAMEIERIENQKEMPWVGRQVPDRAIPARSFPPCPHCRTGFPHDPATCPDKETRCSPLPLALRQ